MTTALAVAEATVAGATQSYVRGGMSYCQQFAGNFWETHFGRPTPNSYASAAAAYRASTIVSHDPAEAPPGAYHYFEYSTLGHVGVALGSGLMASATGYATAAVANLGKSVYVHRVTDYAKHLKYLGWSYTNGARERITGLTDANAPSGPNVRTVKSNANAFRRVSPDAGAALTPKDDRLKAGSAQTITKAYLTGKPITQNGTTTDVWFEVDAYGWAWAGGFTSQSLDGIPSVIDARPKPPPVVKPEPADPDPVPVEPTDPEPEEEPVAETPVIEVPVRVKLDDEALAGLLAKTKEAPEPSQPVVPDAVAKPLWVGLSMVAVSAGPVVVLTLIDWSAWDATIGQQFATTVTAWAGSIAAVLGLSRFAKSK